MSDSLSIVWERLPFPILAKSGFRATVCHPQGRSEAKEALPSALTHFGVKAIPLPVFQPVTFPLNQYTPRVSSPTVLPARPA